MRRWAIFCAVLCVSGLASAHPGGIPTDPPSFLVLEDPGRTSFLVLADAGETVFVVTRSVLPRLDVAFVVTSETPFDLRLRLLLVRDLLPLRVEAEFGLGGALLLGTLRLGPVRVEVARSWGRDEARWGAVRFASRPDASFVVGIRSTRSGIVPLAGFGWRPWARAMMEISVLFDGTGLRLTLGGVG